MNELLTKLHAVNAQEWIDKDYVDSCTEVAGLLVREGLVREDGDDFVPVENLEDRIASLSDDDKDQIRQFIHGMMLTNSPNELH